MKRVILIVLDSVGIGELPDAAKYGDVGSNTLGHIAQRMKISLPTLVSWGLGNILPLENIPPVKEPLAAWGKMASASCGKDTTSGHWEIAGLVLEHPLPTYPHGFPDEVIRPFCEAIDRGILGNIVGSGTQIIDDLGREHMKTGKPIVYTSADSVFQIAAHEKIIPLAELYRICETARNILTGRHGVGRVIARPFDGEPGHFYRTANRHDFSLAPPQGGLTQVLSEAGTDVISVGKIADIFAGTGISRRLPGSCNSKSIAGIKEAMDTCAHGLIFANLIDFDMLYGHRNDVSGYGQALEYFDQELPGIIEKLRPDDMLAISADHGNDPTTPSNDHSREYVPLLIYGEKIKNIPLGIRSTFADLGATISDYLGAKELPAGKSMLNELM